jgi:hypothetical protein
MRKGRNFFKQIQIGLLVTSTLLASISPVFAGLGLPIFEEPPQRGARIYIKDQATVGADTSPVQFVDLYIDMGINENQSEYVIGKLPVYGNGEDDYNGQYSYNTLGLLIDQNGGKSPVKEFGFAVYDWAANSYRTTFYRKVEATPPTYREYKSDVIGKTVDLAKLSTTLGAVFDDAVSKVPVGDVGTGPWEHDIDGVVKNGRIDIKDISYLTSGISVDATNVHKGESDQIWKFLDQLYVYWQTENNERYYFATGLTQGTDAKQDSKVEPPRHLIARAYGTRGTVTYLAPEDPKGIVGYQVDIEDGKGKRMTHQNILFFETEPGKSHKIEVWSLNMEGDESSLVTKDIESQTDQASSYLKDINSAPFFKNYISYGYKLNYWEGFSDKNFKPDDPVTRQALAAFLYKAMRGAIPFNALKMEGRTFSDIDLDNQFFPFVQSLKNAGILVGFSDGTFRPDNVVTRAEGATYIYNAFKSIASKSLRDAGTTCFSDTASTVHGLMICSLARQNSNDYVPIIAGYSSGAYGKDDPLTRAQMATILLKAMALIDIDPAEPDHQSMLTDGTSQIKASEGMGYDVPSTIYAGGNKTGGTGYELTFRRPFVPPIPVEGLKRHAIATHAVELEWRNLRVKDDSVDGFLIEKRLKGTNVWDEVDGVYYTSENTEFVVTLGGAVDDFLDSEEVRVSLNGQDTDMIGVDRDMTLVGIATLFRNRIKSDIPGFSDTSGTGQIINVKYNSHGSISYVFPGIDNITYQIDGGPPSIAGASATGTIPRDSNAQFSVTVNDPAPSTGVLRTRSGLVVKVNQNETTLDLLVGETNVDVASKLATAINRISGVSAQLTGTPLTTIVVTSDISGAKLSYSLPNLTNGDDGITLTTTKTSPISPDLEGYKVKGGYIPAIDFEGSQMVKVTDLDIYSGDTYEYRVRAIKWVPYPFSDEGYAKQEDMIADSQIDVDTIERNSVYSEDSIVEIVVPQEREVY